MKLNKNGEALNIVQIDFQVTLSVCCYPKILLPWQHDVPTSPLYFSFLNRHVLGQT